MFDESNLFFKMVDWNKRLERERRFFKDYLKDILLDEGEILDLGCGIGHHLMMFAEWGFKGLGVDLSETSIELAKQKAVEAKVNHLLEYLFADMREFSKSISERRFDLIICIGNSLALFSLEERRSIVNQAISALKPGGKLILQTVNYMKYSEDTEWTINPNVFRNEEDLLSFFVRILEWADKKKEKVFMHVQRLHQDSKDTSYFNHSQKFTEFYVTKKDVYVLK